jgi:hypothetical protein
MNEDQTHDARFTELAKRGNLTSYERGELKAMRDNSGDTGFREAVNALLGERLDSGGQGGGGQYPILGGAQ